MKFIAFTQTTDSGEATGGFEPPTILWDTSRDLRRTDEKIFGVPPPLLRNVVPANTLVLVAHLVTFFRKPMIPVSRVVGLIIYMNTLTVIKLKYCDDLAYWSATQM